MKGGTLCARCNHDIIWHARKDETPRVSIFSERLEKSLKENKKLLLKIRKLEDQVKKLEIDTKKCIICDENEPNTLLIPCHHAHFCKDCINKWGLTNDTCPTCRETFTSKITYKN